MKTLKRIVELGRRVVVQTKLRILKGISNSAQKIVSVFEPETKILRRGKMHKPTEFGQVVKVQEAEGGIVTDVGVVTMHDSALLVPAVARHIEVFGRSPRVVATDRGFFSHANVRDVEAMGVACAAIPKPGYRSPAWKERERARAWRAGGEARISRLKNTFDMHRTRYRGPEAAAGCAYWAAISNNLVAIARHGG